MKTLTTTIAAALLVTAAFLTLAPPSRAQTPKPNAPPQAAAASLSKEDDQGIRKTVMGNEEAWNTHDMKLLATLFREDAEFINVVGMHWRGRVAIVKAHRVLDAESIYRAFALAELPRRGIPRLDALEDKPWGMREFAMVDPDGNLIRIGQTR